MTWIVYVLIYIASIMATVIILSKGSPNSSEAQDEDTYRARTKRPKPAPYNRVDGDEPQQRAKHNKGLMTKGW